jgi:hypothetical protein
MPRRDEQPVRRRIFCKNRRLDAAYAPDSCCNGMPL